MTKLTWAFACIIAIAFAPAISKAGVIVEASLGRGAQVSPSVDDKWGPVNIMIAPGLSIGQMLRAELGVVMDMPQDNSDTNMRLRPMLVVSPPLLPVYGRLILGVGNLLEGPRSIEYGGALGVGASLAGIGVFAEAGVIPQRVDGESYVILEGRVGAFYIF
ncbi:MAG: hypothetical protein JW841_04000 [Deltaproteobacteria bacterium]|nr:hypothetical protein [Deltaproteobacteria bacterium]